VTKNKRSKKRAREPEAGEKQSKPTTDVKSDDKTTKKIVSRHAGILGLCAFVNAFPYDVPEFVPDILMFLSGYIHEVQPISVSTSIITSRVAR
jgi:hypothetical protein